MLRQILFTSCIFGMCVKGAIIQSFEIYPDSACNFAKNDLIPYSQHTLQKQPSSCLSKDHEQCLSDCARLCDNLLVCSQFQVTQVANTLLCQMVRSSLSKNQLEARMMDNLPEGLQTCAIHKERAAELPETADIESLGHPQTPQMAPLECDGRFKVFQRIKGGFVSSKMDMTNPCQCESACNEAVPGCDGWEYQVTNQYSLAGTCFLKRERFGPLKSYKYTESVTGWPNSYYVAGDLHQGA